LANMGDDQQAVASKLAAVQDRVHQFLQPSSTTSKKPISWKRPLEPNADHLKALDHALRCGTMGRLTMASFQAVGGPRALQADEERYFVPVTELPRELGEDLGVTRRACVKDNVTGNRFLVIQWQGERNILHEVMDQASIGNPARYWVYQTQRLRGWNWFDPHHRRWNNWKADVKRSGAKSVMLETSLVVSMKKGPWSGAANFWKLSQTARSYFENFDAKDKLFGLLYDDICTDFFHDKVPANKGSEQHMSEVFQRCKSCPWFVKKGSKVKKSRWFQWSHEVEPLSEWYTVILLVLLFYSLSRGWYASIEKTPLHSNFKPVSADADPADAPADNIDQHLPDQADIAKKRTSQDEEKAFKATRQAQDMVHLCCNILCNRSTRRVMLCMWHLSEPVRIDHDKTVTMLKTQLSSVQWHQAMADDGWRPRVLEVTQKLVDPGVLAHIGFEGASAPLEEEADNDMKDLAAFMFDFFVETCASIISFSSTYSHGLPGCFAGLVQPESDAGKNTLSYLQRVWELYVALEKISLEDYFFAQLLNIMMWPSNVWVLEILMGCAECEFRGLPKVASSEVLGMCRSQSSTKLIEDIGNVMRASERQHTASKLGRMSRWHHTAHCQVLPEADLQQPTISSNDRVEALASVKKNVFDCSQADFSLGKESLDDFIEKKTTYHSPAPEHLHQSIDLLGALLSTMPDLQKMKQSWFSLLCAKGSYLKNVGGRAEDEGLVVQVSQWACTLVALKPARAQGIAHFKFVVDAKDVQMRVVPVCDLASWRVCEIEPLPPGSRSKMFKEKGATVPEGILLLPGRYLTLLVFAAHRAFSNLTLSRVRDLSRIEKIQYKGPNRPTTDYEFRRHLVAHALKLEYNDESVAAVLEKYNYKARASRFATTLSAEAAVLSEGVLNNEDVQEIREEVAKNSIAAEAKAKPKAAKAAKGTAVAAGAAAGSGSSREALAVVRKPRLACDPAGAVVDVEWARAFLPKPTNTKCVLKKDGSFHFRFVVEYPAPNPPRSTSKSWNESISEWDSCKFCLHWAWKRHEELTGEPCPWDFDAM